MRRVPHSHTPQLLKHDKQQIWPVKGTFSPILWNSVSFFLTVLAAIFTNTLNEIYWKEKETQGKFYS